MLKYLIILTYLIQSFIFSANRISENYFYGRWELDIEKSLVANLASKSLKADLKKKLIGHKITFSRSGEYKERFGNVITKGTWSRYKEDLAVVRIESDEKIFQRRARLKVKLLNPKLTRYQKTRLEQRLFFLDRASVKSYDYKNGYLILSLNRQDKNIKLFFRKEI
tara:strand:+ start:547 stop:1044 length:498 start_codon:yes stop_codon:yes gene_type:complete